MLTYSFFLKIYRFVMKTTTKNENKTIVFKKVCVLKTVALKAVILKTVVFKTNVFKTLVFINNHF